MSARALLARNPRPTEDEIRHGISGNLCRCTGYNKIVAEMLPGKNVQSDDELLHYLRQTGSTVFHATCTCKMGQDAMAVVDDQLRVRGLENLRVIDASIMPTMPSANLNASVLMIAEKAADMIRSRAPLEATMLKD